MNRPTLDATLDATLASDASPFHAGEQALQAENGKREMMERFGRKVIRPYMPDQHRAFFAQLPFLAVGAVDADGWPWATLLPGAPGFAQSPDPQNLDIALNAPASDPVRKALRPGAPLGILGIELETRRRNRLNGRVTSLEPGQMRLRVDQSFGNCPQYIQHRDVEFLRAPEDTSPSSASAIFQKFDAEARRRIASADVFFVASAIPARDNPVNEGVDVSHRGGRPGFIKVEGNTLLIPDFPGNNHFNTFGNFLLNPKAGLVFPDFETGTMLTLTGHTELLAKDDPALQGFRGAERGWRFTLSHGLWLRNALPFRAKRGAASPNSLLADTWGEVAQRTALETRRNSWRSFRVARMQQESSVIRSFYLEPADGAPVLPFQAGQFLTLRASSSQGVLTRSYTISSDPGEAFYRISVKREEHGAMSRLLHDEIIPGAMLEVKSPRGDFFIDAAETRPAVLLAGGVGITPMISMANHVLREGLRTRHLRPLTVLHATKNSAQRAFADDFRALQQTSEGQIRYYSIASAPKADEQPGTDYNGTGRITADTLRQVLALDDYDFFLCGPAPFMQGVYDSLRDLGVADVRIFAEGFGPASLTRRLDETAQPTDQDVPAADEADAALVTFAKTDGATSNRSSTEHSWSPADGTLLELAEAHGHSPAFSCRTGSCGSCATRLRHGAVSYRKTPTAAHEADEVLLCCARPARLAKGSAPLELDL
ncbi:pyridoxamine 5'-phosphate oxidase family protein [Pseudophaeobacter sp.]|uniref:FAD-binding oxidoreductase n=1 Tax=Pseudophaeobacter sp. TaxID=1971739 RepID=UPI00329707B8